MLNFILEHPVETGLCLLAGLFLMLIAFCLCDTKTFREMGRDCALKAKQGEEDAERSRLNINIEKG